MSANYISKDEEAELRKVFRFIDSDRKSYLTKTKIEKTLKENGNLCTVQEIDDIIKALDIDRNGVIEYQEYIQGLCDKQALFSEINLKDLFTYMDNDNKGYLTSEDIKNFAFQNKTVNDEAFKEYLKQFGMKIDDKLNFDDFLYIIQNNCSLNNQNENIKLQTKKSEKAIIFKSYSNIYTDIDEESSDLSEEDNSNNKSTQNSDLRNGKYFAKK